MSSKSTAHEHALIALRPLALEPVSIMKLKDLMIYVRELLISTFGVIFEESCIPWAFYHILIR